MLNMLPKFELVPIIRYFMTLPKVRRPSSTPSCSTRRSCSSRIMSAASLRDVDGAVDRDADVGRVQRRRVVDAVAQVADDVAAPLRSARMMRFFCAGVTRQKRLTCRDRAASACSSMAASSVPVQHALDAQAELARRRGA